MPKIQTLSQAEGERRRRQGALLLDVRTPEEFRAGHLPGSMLLPLERLPGQISSIAPDRGRTLLLYCSRGERSRAAAQVLASMGYHQVYVLRP
ncbi:MAG: rhodanese-like domain-containing protein [Firmicutes bacterium]|nr:rhodanese-like domain-containing protein [Bacillota bacterium]